VDASTIPTATNQDWGFCGTIGHFADDVGNELFIGKRLPDAIDAVSEHWLGWMISR
jgi:hypothetical protein